MRLTSGPHRTRRGWAALVGGVAVTVTALLAPALPVTPVHATDAVVAAVGDAADPAAEVSAEDCVEPHDGPSASARGGRAADHRELSASEVSRVQARTSRILARQDRTAGRSTAARASQVARRVPVHVHVMLSSTGAGDVTDRQVRRQVQVLNRTYAGTESRRAARTGFSFALAGIDRIRNDVWHRDGQSAAYRARTREGGRAALNLWLVDFSYLGVATFPWDYQRRPQQDGVRIDYATLPGGPAKPFDQGKTATHEVGHWLGLLHTFQGGCGRLNDRIADTPAQASASRGCPTGRDSCSRPGADPIRNYMDYSNDACYDQFTPDQGTRMRQMWSAYRGQGAPA